jgi:hypothetical protein
MASTLNISDIQLFNTLKKKLGEKEAEDLVAFVKTSIKDEITDVAPSIATKDFVDSKISESKAEIIKWMFVFVFSSTILTIGSILAILKFFVSK